MIIPDRLKKLSRYESEDAWLETLPRLISELTELWGIEPGEPYEDANVSYVAPGRRMQQRVVIKIQWPHEECSHEADALKVWDGNGAVKLLDHDETRHALLLEHCSPGTHLSAADCDDKLAVLVDLLPRLWKPVSQPFIALSDEARGWASRLYENWDAAGQVCERRLIDVAAALLEDLAPSQGEQVLVHQDLHGDNVLAAEREAWLAIDPKPLAGEREFAIAPIVRSFEFGHSRTEVVGRLDRLTAELALDRERARGWAIAQTVAWSFDSDSAQQHYETVRWLMDAR